MKTILLTLILGLLFIVCVAAGQTVDPATAKMINAPTPVFPEEAKKLIYGESVRVLIDVDKQGRVTGALAFGPLTPCSNLEDQTIEKVRVTAVEAAKATVFKPETEDGKSVQGRLTISYRLRPISKPLSREEHLTINGGVINSKTKVLVQPDYPAAALVNRLKGGITIAVLVGENGKVLSAGALSGHPLFSRPGVIAACKAQFAPTTLQGEPAKIFGYLSYNFFPDK